LGIHRELRMDSTLSQPYSADDIVRIENFAEELANEKITGALYVMGIPYSDEHIRSTVYAMTVDPVAYSLYGLDKERGRTAIDYEKNRSQFTRTYQAKARALVNSLLASGRQEITDQYLCQIAGITQAELDSARTITATVNGSKDMLSRMMVMGAMMTPPAEQHLKLSDRQSTSGMKRMMARSGMSPEKAIEMAKKMGADEEAVKKMEAAMKRKQQTGRIADGGNGQGHPGGVASQSGSHGKPHGMKRSEYTKQELDFANAVTEVERAVKNVGNYRSALTGSPEAELSSVVNALAGGYIAPTSGGDPVLNPDILPTGRNMFAVNAEETPSAVAWEKGESLADNTISM
ncbi:MAG: cobaltochelatase subunit CobN, partial [Duncaniella sp.]|nr:cobaltochelatase subunit CobN [Duncaniella sp.]